MTNASGAQGHLHQPSSQPLHDPYCHDPYCEVLFGLR
jgi:hypothetical protein